MITPELRIRAEELKKTECVHRDAWIALVDDLIAAADDRTGPTNTNPEWPKTPGPA